MTDQPKRGLRWKHILWILAISAGVYAALVIGQDVTARIRLARVTAAMHAEGQPVTWTEFTNRFPDSHRQVVAVSNLLGALASCPSFDTLRDNTRQANLPVVGTAALPEPDAPLQPEMTAAIEELLSPISTNLFAVRTTLAGEGQLRLEPNVPLMRRLPRLGQLRHGARLLKLCAIHAAGKDDADGAMKAVADGLRLAAIPGRTPLLIERLTGFACADLALSAMERTLARTDPSPSVLEEVEAVLRALDDADQPPYAEVPSVAARYDDLLAARDEDAKWLKEEPLDEGMLQWRLLWLRGPALRGWIRTNKAWDLAVLDSDLRNWSLPWGVFQERHVEASRSMPRMCFLARTGVDILPSYRAHELHFRGRRHCARLALAIKAYTLAEGKLPPQLEDLRPKYISEVGMDPFSGKPLRYTTENGKGVIGFTDPSTGRDVTFRVYLPAASPKS